MNWMKTYVGQLAYTYSGSPWVLWLQAISTTWVSAYLLTRHVTGLSIAGSVMAIIAISYWSALVYYYRHRAELAANPAKPIRYSLKQLAWIIALTLGIIAVGVVLVSVWHW
jgi:hypothetical protein